MQTITKDKLRLAFEELGGQAALLNVLNDFYSRMSNDTMIGFFFAGKDIKEIAKKQYKFLLKAAGVTNTYEGKIPREAHTKLPPIHDGFFRRRLVILRETLEDYNLSQARIEDWIAFENSFFADIVKKPS